MSKKRKKPRKTRGKRSSARKGRRSRKRRGALGSTAAATAKGKSGIGKIAAPIGGLVVGAALSNMLGHLIDKAIPVAETETEGIQWKRFIKPVILGTGGVVLLGFSDKLKKFIKSDTGVSFAKGLGGGLLVGATISVGKITLKDKLPILDKLPFTDGLGNDKALESGYYEDAKESLRRLLADNNHPLTLDEGSSSYVSGMGASMPGSSLHLDEMQEAL